MIFIEDHNVTVKYKTALKVLWLYFNVYLSVKLDNLSYSFIFISSLTTRFQKLYIFKVHRDGIFVWFIY